MKKRTKGEWKLIWEEWRIKLSCNVKLAAGIVGALLLFALFIIGIFQIRNQPRYDMDKKVHDYVASLLVPAGTDGITKEQMEELAESVTVLLEERIAGKDTLDEASMENIKVLIKEELKKKDSNLTDADMERILKDFDSFLRKDYMPYLKRLEKEQEALAEDVKNTGEALKQKAELGEIDRLDESDQALQGTDKELAGEMERLDAKMGAQKDSLAEGLDQLSRSTSDKLKQTEKAFGDKLEEMRSKLEEGGLDTKDKLGLIMEALSGQADILRQSMYNLEKSFHSQFEEQTAYVNNLWERSDKEWTDTLEKYAGQAAESAARAGEELALLAGRVALNEAAIGDLLKQVDECFGLVSNGKALLASTLTDKGVVTVADASFEVINNSIMALYARGFRNGADSVSGTNAAINYIRHYHVGADGQEMHDTYNNMTIDVPGGCYTQYHSHSSGCYGECRIVGEYIRKYKNSSGWTVEEWNCPVHGTYTHQSLHEDDHRGTKCGARILNCPLAEGYGLSCGMVEGQIISATIDFRQPEAQVMTAADKWDGGGNSHEEASREAPEEETQDQQVSPEELEGAPDRQYDSGQADDGQLLTEGGGETENAMQPEETGTQQSESQQEES